VRLGYNKVRCKAYGEGSENKKHVQDVTTAPEKEKIGGIFRVESMLKKGVRG